MRKTENHPMPLRAAIHEFFVEGTNRKQSHVLLHITEPATPAEWEKGYFFALVELEHASIEQIQHMQQIIDDLEAGYYESEDGEDKNAFEATLEYLNRRSGNILELEGSVHCIVGTFCEKRISFAYHGAPHALLFYNAKGSLHYTNILTDEEPHEDQLFSSILEGQLNEGDSFFIATPGVSEQLPHEEFHRLLSSMSPEKSVRSLEETLRGAESVTSFGGILLHVPKTPRPAIVTPNKVIQGSEESLNHLFEAEKKTAATLSPPLMGTIRETLAQRDKTPKTRRETTKKRQTAEFNYRPSSAPLAPNGSPLNTALIYIGRGLVQGALGLWKIISAIGITIWRGFVMLLVLLTNKNNGRRDLTNRLADQRARFVDSFRSLSILSKILLSAALLLAATFVASIGYLRIKEERDVRKQVYLDQIDIILAKKDDAEASSIYGNDEKSFSLLKEAEAMIAALPAETEEQQQKREELEAEIKAGIQKIQKVEVVPQTLVADLGSSVASPVPYLTKIEDLLVAYGSDDKHLLTIDLTTSQVDTKIHDTLPALLGASTPKEQDAIVFLTADDTVATYDTQTHTVSLQQITHENTDPSTIGPFVYSTRLYLVDKNAHQIYRHNKTSLGYDKGSPWLPTPDIDLGDAVSLAIDGSIYVLQSDGDIVKYTQGVREVFTVKGLEPALTAPTHIWTYNTTDNLYILEPDQKRIVVLDKIGRLVRQYTASEWQRPTGMVVDETENKIYVIDNNTVYSFSTK